ncbi:MAG: hypothetical protein SFY92_06435 [Verrucomicrobiae bacterium]|nr:hypothetical protein [Verrucomicrobiae bacterium]
MTAEEKIKYQKLPGAGLRRDGVGHVVGVRSRLYQGPDHLLSLDTTMGFMESYKRFYYQDIQAFVIRQTHGWLIGACVFGILGAFFAMIILMFGSVEEPEIHFFLGVLAACMIGIALWNLATGPSCITYIKTAAQTESLPSLNRIRKARKVINRIRPLIEAAQGTLTADQIATAQHPSPPPNPSALTETHTPPSPPRAARVIPAGTGRIHLLYFSLCVVTTAALTLKLWFMPLWLYLFLSLLSAGAWGALIISLVDQSKTRYPAGIRIVTWAALGTTVMAIIIGYAFLFSHMRSKPSLRSNHLDFMQYMASLHPFTNPWTQMVFTYEIITGLGVGVTGLVLTLRYRRDLKMQAPASPAPPSPTPPPPENARNP